MPWADPAAVDLSKLRVAFFDDNGATGRTATDEDTKKTVRRRPKLAARAPPRASHEDAPKDVLDAAQRPRAATSAAATAGAFYKRLADKWGTKNFSPSVARKPWRSRRR